jgi:transposase
MEMSAVLELSRSTVSAVIVKWKRLSATTAQPQSGRPHKITEWEFLHCAKCAARKNGLSLVATLTTSSKLHLEATSAH